MGRSGMMGDEAGWEKVKKELSIVTNEKRTFFIVRFLLSESFFEGGDGDV